MPASITLGRQPVTDYLGVRLLGVLLRRSLKYLFRPLPQVRIVRQAPAIEPLVSVIIPTYNRSNVLRTTIQSVLWQTEQDFELLVMGDGCTDNSEEVVQSFGDARITWHNLPSNSGHQSAPVNAGLARSRGRYISFLGHDDIWHPDHLRTQLQALNAVPHRSFARHNSPARKQGDSAVDSAPPSIAISVVEMRGPRDAHYRVLANFFPGDRHDPAKCSPPSGLMITREVHERVGPWNDYRTIWRNPECEFQYQAFLAKFRFVPTGELTVYKFTSTLWKDPYIEKPCGEQKVYLERILSQRWFLLKETLDIAWVHLLRLPMYVPALPPPPSPRTPGWHVSYYRKFRGLE